MNFIWLFLLSVSLLYGMATGKIISLNQMLIEVGQDTFDFALYDGQIILFFPEYEFFAGAYGPVTVETGIFVNFEQVDGC